MTASKKQALMKRIFAGSLIFYAFSGISSLLNYIFYPILARFVSVAEYGEIQFLVSMFTQLAVGFVVLNILAIVISGEIKSNQDQRLAIKSLNKVASILVLCIVIIGSLILYGNQQALGFQDSTAIIALGVSLVISVPFTIEIGRLQGNNKFAASGLVSVIAALSKLIFSLIFVLLGFGVTGAIAGIGVGMIITLCLLRIFDKQTSHPPNPVVSRKRSFAQLGFIKKRAIIAMVAISTVTFLSSADSITSRLYLSSYSAGEYAAVATLAKVILAATSPLMWLALPPAIAHNKQKIFYFIAITTATAAMICVALSLFPVFFVHTLLGIDAGVYTQVLPIASVAMGLYSIAFVLMSVGVCVGLLRSVLISSLLAVVIYLGIFFTFQVSAGPIYASLYGQIASAICIIIGGFLSLHTHSFKPNTSR